MDKKEAITLLKDILKIDSTNGNEKAVADYLTTALDRYGIASEQVEYAKGRNQLIASLKGKQQQNSKKLGFTGHMDVVPVGEIPWKYPPFSATEEDGKIYARGSSDMKAGLAAQVVAMIELKEQGLPFAGEIQLLATVGEETSAIGAGQLVELGYGSDLDALVIGEPTNNLIVIAHKGALWLRITTLGKTAHGSMPSEGINAVEHMLKLLTRFQEKFDFSLEVDELVGASTSSIDVIHGGNGTNVIPDTCTVEIDIRTIAKQDHQLILKDVQSMITELQETIPNLNATIEVINDLESVRTEKDDAFVELVYSTVESVTGNQIKPFGGPGYTDGSQFTKAKKKYPIVILGPGIGEMAHQPNEYVEINAYLQSIEIYKKLALSYLTETN